MNMNKDKIEQKFQEIEKSIPLARTPITFEQLEAVIAKWLLIKDRWIIKVMAGIVLANKLKGDPVWLFIVAASGGTKTELIRGLNSIHGIYPISDLTPQTFLSGEKGNKNASLLLRLPAESTILTYKDFTTVLTMHRDKRHAILSQLREIYDGYYRKEFGTGETKTWIGKMGFIAGVTSVIDSHQTIFQVLGERFIQYRPEQPDAIALARKAMANSGGEKPMREEIENAFADFIAGIQIPEEAALISEDCKDRIAHLAAFCVRARSGIIRDGFSSREIDLIPDSEMPTRLAKQLITMASAFALIGNATPEEDYELIYKIGMDSLPHKRKKTLETLLKATSELETADIAMKIGYPTNSTRRILEDLHGLRLTERMHEGQGYADRWLISDNAKELLEKSRPAGLKSPLEPDRKDTLPDMSDDFDKEAESFFVKEENGALPEMSADNKLD